MFRWQGLEVRKGGGVEHVGRCLSTDIGLPATRMTGTN
jgi:hypothetical protein